MQPPLTFVIFGETKFNSVFIEVARTHTTHYLQEYFYEVKDRFRRAERNYYNAGGGYMSTNVSLAFLHEKKERNFMQD